MQRPRLRLPTPILFLGCASLVAAACGDSTGPWVTSDGVVRGVVTGPNGVTGAVAIDMHSFFGPTCGEVPSASGYASATTGADGRFLSVLSFQTPPPGGIVCLTMTFRPTPSSMLEDTVVTGVLLRLRDASGAEPLDTATVDVMLTSRGAVENARSHDNR